MGTEAMHVFDLAMSMLQARFLALAHDGWMLVSHAHKTSHDLSYAGCDCMYIIVQREAIQLCEHEQICQIRVQLTLFCSLLSVI